MDTVLVEKAAAGGTTCRRGLEFNKKSARPNSVKLPLEDYLDQSVLDQFMTPSIPRSLGRRTRATNWGMSDHTAAALLDAADERHPFSAYLTITPYDPVGLAAAACLFGAVDVELRVPDFAIQQFEAGQPWSPREPHGQPNILGSHHVAVLGRSYGMFDLVTWGQRHQMDDMFYRCFCNEASVHLSQEFLQAGKFPEGFNMTQLHLDLKALMYR